MTTWHHSSCPVCFGEVNERHDRCCHHGWPIIELRRIIGVKVLLTEGGTGAAERGLVKPIILAEQELYRTAQGWPSHDVSHEIIAGRQVVGNTGAGGNLVGRVPVFGWQCQKVLGRGVYGLDFFGVQKVGNCRPTMLPK